MTRLRSALAAAFFAVATPALAHVGSGAHSHTDSGLSGGLEIVLVLGFAAAALLIVGGAVNAAIGRMKHACVRVRSRRNGR